MPWLFLDFHHIVSDGTSTAVFIQDVNDAYELRALNKESYTGYELSANAFFNAVFVFVLGRFTGKKEALYTTVYNGRSDSRTSRSVTMMVKTFPVFYHLNAGENVRSFVESIGSQLMSSMAHDLYSFAEIAEEYGIASDVLFAYQGTEFLHIPVQIDSKKYVFRCGRKIDCLEEGERTFNEYEIFGVWQGYEEDNELMNRSVTPLAMLGGRDYRLLYPIDDGTLDERESYQIGEMQTMYRSLKVEEIPLPPGIYYLEYEVQDMFLRTFLLDRIEIHWDGENMTFPEGFTWEGKADTKRTVTVETN